MSKPLILLGLALILPISLSACADLKCSPEYCDSDAKITAQVREVFSQHSEFGAPGQLKVQTINGVVYLNGRVNTDLTSRNAEALVWQVPNVKNVVNSFYSNAAY